VARFFTPVRLLVAGIVLLAVVGIVYIAPSNEYILLPVTAQKVAPYVKVAGEQDDQDGGGIYYVAVEVRKASIFEKLFHSLYEGSTLVPQDEIRAPGESESQRRKVGLRQMEQSQDIAPIVAFRELGYDVDRSSPGTVIAGVAPDGPSAGKLKPQDVVVRVDGERSPSAADLRRLIRKHRPGETVRLTFRRGSRLRSVTVKTIADPEEPGRPLVGVLPDCAPGTAQRVDLPMRVGIDVGQVGGPSAGLAFALDIVEELGRDVDHGHKIAATGALCVDGTVIPVGGLKQKTIGARHAGADIFLVPAGDNTNVARRYAGDMRVLPVQSFRQALHELATIPKTSRGR
jgi:Lon-like protease